MSMSEPFSFGRKIKELKRTFKKSYADLTAGLKISRERIIALEEGEREPTDIERQRFAAFYNLPVEEFSSAQGRLAPRPAPVPTTAPTTPSQAPVSRPTGYSSPGSPGNNYAGSTQGAPRPPMNNRPAPGGTGQSTPRPPVQARPKPASGDENGEKKPQDGKPVMKYTAEQLGDIESAYLRKQRDLKVPLRFTFLNGQEFTGVVTDFTPFTIHIMDEDTKEEVILRKLAIAYYRKSDALETAGKEGSE
jgi:transcriptional regulator with XRE-family HTH domain/sRNA-binding regulator protein Hfq